MKLRNIIIIAAVLLSSAGMVKAQNMADYTAYPPFVTTSVAPNILMVLDHSGSMQFPAYIGCDFTGYDTKRAMCGSSNTTSNPEYNYNSTRDYYGYFEKDKYYEYGTNKFIENAACSFAPSDAGYRIGNTSGCYSGNLMNWASTSRIDALRKALIGGRSVSKQGNAHTLQASGGWRKFTDDNLGCIFDIAGGSYPNLDHTISISSTGVSGTCGYLTVWANGSTMWDRRDRFRYVYQSVNGNFDASLLIVTPPTETAQTYAKAGLIVRNGTNSRDAHVKAMATNGAGLQFSYRSAYNKLTYLIGSYVPATYPIWVRIVRSGNLFTYYYSSDGTAWTTHGSQTIGLNSNTLIGMGATSYSSGTLGKAEFDTFNCSTCSSDNFNDGAFNSGIWTATDIYTTKPGNQVEACGAIACPVGNLTNASLQVDVPDSVKEGVIHVLSDKDRDGSFDPGAPRFGLMTYNSDNVGCVKTGIDGSNMSSLLTALQNEPPYNGTPTGEALNEAWDYFKQVNANAGCNNNAYMGGVGSVKDPWYENATSVDCRKSFVLLISDGEWNGSIDPVIPARQTHITDIRSDMDGTQSLNHFSVYSFGYDAAGENSMQQIGLYGGFDDYDGDTWPYNRTAYPADSRTATLPAAPCDPSILPMSDNCKEWDKDLDGLPDTYYIASEGDQLELQLVKAVADILKQSSSGTAVSVLATTGEGEGAIYQAYFFPEKLEGLESRKWLGYLHGLFVDKYGNMREDTNNDSALDLKTDYILEMQYSTDMGTTVNKFSDTDGDGVKDSSTPSATVPLSSLNTMWNAGNILWQTSAASRDIFTTTDGYTKIDFTSPNAVPLLPYLRAADSTESTNIINWTRGENITSTIDAGHAGGYRPRDITINGVTNEWKLGDIIYSTPTIVGRPMENYDLLYGDIDYAAYRATHIKRRQVIYVGSNDGMLHAFNGGCFNETDHKFYSDVDSSGNCITGGRSLGQELWAFIPRAILPHLKWSTSPDYTHVYTVDLKPKITDVKMFTPDSKHKNGWGTILIGGFRYGGKDISWTSGGTAYTASPEYFALDITDPLNPTLLWTFSDPDMGFSMSYPAISKIGDKWYAVFGSGPINYDTGSNLLTFQDGYVYALDMSSGSSGVISTWTKDGNFWKLPTGNTNAFLVDPISVDVDIDFDVDAIYIGENYKSGTKWYPQMKRITTNKGTSNPSGWVLSTLGDVSTIAGAKDDAMKITSPPSAAMDDRANLYIYFGTGQFYGTDDKNSTDTGAFYAIKDKCWDGSCTTSYSSLMDVSGASVATDSTVSGVSGACIGSTSNWSNLLSTAEGCDGWALYFNTIAEATDFTGAALTHAGERMVTKPLVIGGLVMWASYIPGTEQCSYEGESNAYAVYYKTGSAYNDYIFKEQKQQTSPSTTVGRVRKLGAGMPSSMSAQITSSGTAKGFVQQSTGSILEIESITPVSLKSDVTGWKSEPIQ